MVAPSYVRASALPDLEKCPAKLVTSAGEPDDTHEKTKMGSAFHRVMENRARKVDQSIEEVAKEFGVPSSGLAFLDRQFAWSPHDTPRIVAWGVEQELVAEKVVGHADLYLYREKLDGRMIVETIDYKSGDPEFGVDAKDSLQVKWYAAARAIEFDKVDEVQASIAYVRGGDEGWSFYYFSSMEEVEEVLNHAERIAVHALDQFDLEEKERTYQRGSHCEWCSGRYRCPVYLRYIRSITGDANVKVTSDTAVEIYQMASGAERQARVVKEVVQQYVKQHGSCPSGDGQWLLEERSYNRKIFLSEAIVLDALKESGVTNEGIREAILERCRDRPEELASRCQPYRIKARGKRDA